MRNQVLADEDRMQVVGLLGLALNSFLLYKARWGAADRLMSCCPPWSLIRPYIGCDFKNLHNWFVIVSATSLIFFFFK